MLWAEFTVCTSQEASEAVAYFLQEAGSNGVSLQDQGSRVRITAFFLSDDRIGERVERLRSLLADLESYGLSTHGTEIEIARIEDKDWENEWKSAFPPQRIGKHWLVAPSWEEITPTPHERLILLDPGMAFGTGYHATTQLVLCLLEDVGKGAEAVLDLGTGSGILAIAAVKLGAAHVLATDVDEQALLIARQNAEMNGVSEQIEWKQGSLFDGIDGTYDLIVANILAQVLLPMIPDSPRYLNPGGHFVLSGILQREDATIQATIGRSGLQTVRRLRQEEWLAYAGTLV